jgi:surface protein
MFYECSVLKELNITNFRTKNITDMSFMFSGCSSLKELDISNIKFNDKIDINKIFYRCSDELKKNVRAQNKSIPEKCFS